MNRRTVLGTMGVLLSPSFIGCLTNGSEPSSGTTSDDSVSSATASPTFTPESTLAVGDSYEMKSGETITVADVLLRRSVFDLLYPDAVRPLAPSDAQFVFLTLSLDAPDAFVPDAGSFRLLLDGQRLSGATSAGGVDLDFYLSVPNDGVYPSPETAAENDFNNATVAFEVPLHVEHSRVLVEWVGDDESARWTWDDDFVRALRSPPDFRVDAVDVPDGFACDEPFESAVTVANDGGREDIFHAIIGVVEPARDEHPTSVSVPIPAGGEEVWTGKLQYPPQLSSQSCDEDVEFATFELDWGTATRQVTIERRA